MTITLFADKNYRGKSLVVTRNWRDLDDATVGRNPSSLTMSSDNDAVLLFKGKDWDGGVMCFRCKRSMTSLGKKSEGGELLAGNTVASVRVTPFTLKLNVSVVTTHDNPRDLKSPVRYPGDYDSEAQVRINLGKAVLTANQFFARENAMIELAIADVHFRMNDGLFEPTVAKVSTSVPGGWKVKRQIDVIVVHSLKGAYGVAKMPWWGQIVVIEMKDRFIGQVARTLAHELGHFLGLPHGSGDGAAKNIMTPSDQGLPIDQTVMLDEQIEEMQQKLARNLTRQGDRIA